jgi:hypothetical protein
MKPTPNDFEEGIVLRNGYLADHCIRGVGISTVPTGNNGSLELFGSRPVASDPSVPRAVKTLLKKQRDFANVFEAVGARSDPFNSNDP